MLTLATAYRMLISENGACIKKGESCLIWGASGGLGAYAIQLCNLIGAIPIAVVSSDERELYCRKVGCEKVINLSRLGFKNFVMENGEPNYLMWQKLKIKLTSIHKPGIDVVFEHIGRETLGASVYVLRRGGRVVTCAASSGYQCNIDLRYLWMEVKKIIGSHFANFEEAARANELMASGKIKCTTDTVIHFKEIPEYLDKMQSRKVIGGKIGVTFD
jgi:crotonyl-CoA reductase